MPRGGRVLGYWELGNWKAGRRPIQSISLISLDRLFRLFSLFDLSGHAASDGLRESGNAAARQQNS
jgi:hypothetical protein